MTNPGFGLVAKVQNPNDGNWHTNCYNGGDPKNGVKVTGYGKDSLNWTYLEGEWSSGTSNFLPIFYLALENANDTTATVNGQAWNWHPEVDIDTVFIGEDLGSGSYGPNIVSKPSMEQLSYYMERNAYAFDKTLDIARQNDVYLKLVIMEKNEQIENEIGYDGNKAPFDNNNFYGKYRTMTAVRWYQQAWWRYLQARWGYSPNIFSFEAVNEALPGYTNHYGQVDEMGKYLHCGVFGLSVLPYDGQKCTLAQPNAHMVSTSFSDGFERNLFASDKYPNIDYADIHRYIAKDGDLEHFTDTALSNYDLGLAYGAYPSGSGKPIIRGETGLINQAANTNSMTDVSADTQGIWLHNILWGSINPTGLIDNWWYAKDQIYKTVDLRSQYKNYYTFIKDIPLNNGKYVDAAATTSNAKIRAWGQKDLTNQRVHLWIANTDHVWTNTSTITPINGTVTVSGLAASTSFNVEWWNTYTGMPSNSQVLSSNASGQLILTVSNLNTDTAVKITRQGSSTTNPTATPTKTLVPTYTSTAAPTGVFTSTPTLTPLPTKLNTTTPVPTLNTPTATRPPATPTRTAAPLPTMTAISTSSPQQPTIFEDVPVTHPYWKVIETLYVNGLTSGCSTAPLKFCPDQIMDRAQAAVFMMRAKYGLNHVPPPPVHLFADDWTRGTWAEPWAEGAYRSGLSAGCGTSPLKYCPWNQLPREQVAILALRLKYGNDYTPPPATGTVFADTTPTTYYATAWLEQAYADQIIPNCGTDPASGKPLICPKDMVTRGLAAYIIVRAKNLKMP